ncbi:hypothetical protein HQ585_09280 [candidate division KSB1 bacterium]|nr:hypothetical protein [candidate division KSB1 bacterium]
MRIAKLGLSLFVLTVIMMSCNKKTSTEPEKTGSVSGMIMNITLNQPVSDIMVYLLDKSNSVDTLTFKNESLFVDSAKTDSLGKYIFDKIKTGCYAVLPIEGRTIFKHETFSDPYEFEIKGGEAFDIDFTTELAVDMTPGYFNTTINIVNCPDDAFKKIYQAGVYRQYWFAFIPLYNLEGELTPTEGSDNSIRMTFTTDYGFSIGLFTLANAFKVVVIFNVHAGYEDIEMYFGTPLSGTPERVSWEYDWETGMVEQITQ